MNNLQTFCLSVIVPCYNSAGYMSTALDSVLAAGYPDVEVIIVNDGSADTTQEIADAYAHRYPDTVQAINQVNKGHGGAVNTGIMNARGMYIKVLDSDDWFEPNAFRKVVNALRMFAASESPVDAIVSNYVYEKQGSRSKRVIRYTNVFPEDQVVGWDDIGRFRLGQYLMMHSLIYRTEILKNIGFQLPEHTFYVDNLFVSVPLVHVRTLYYVNADLYRYFIGREDQSINESVMIRRIDQQLKVNFLVIENFLANCVPVSRTKVSRYLFHHLEVVTAISSIMLIRSGTKEHLAVKHQLWQTIESLDAELSDRMRKRLVGVVMNLPGRFGRMIAERLYIMSRFFFGFN